MSQQSLSEISHLGLAIARYLPDTIEGQTPPHTPKDDLIAALAGAGEFTLGTFSNPPASTPSGYDRYYQRVQHAATRTGHHTRVLTLASLGRCAVGLGIQSPLENSLSTHHTYGVPVLTGSALKGLCAAFARRHYEGWHPDLPEGPYRRVFGYSPVQGRQGLEMDVGAAGLVTFGDALPLPGKWNLHREVMTTHHPEYYRGLDGRTPPADWDKPIPVPFLSASGTFTLVLSARPNPDAQAALDAACALLTAALAEEGVGAKTSSGFGRFTVSGPAPVDAAAPASAAQPQRPPPAFPTWLATALSAHWKPRELENTGSRIHHTAGRVVREAQEGTLAPDLAHLAAQALLTTFSAVPAATLRKYKWYSDLLALAESSPG